MDPTPPEDQTWTIWSIMAYWATDTINLGTWETASGILSVGLSWREALPIMVVGTFCVAVPMVLNGAIGAKLHVPFSVITTSSFGYYLRYFCIISRAILAMFWLGIQGANGAQCITIMLRAIAPSYNNIPNHLPASAAIDTKGMCSYFLFWIIQLPLLLIHPTKLRPIFIIKLIGAPIAAIATMGWCLHRAGGGGDIWHLRAEVHGSTYAWLWLSCMSSVTGSWATLACNIPDFTRYARSAKGQFVQLPFLPIIFTLCGILGIVTTSATKIFTGEYMWNPLDIISLWLDMGSGGRCAAFFAALAWYIAQVGTNITANSISAANDLTVLFPRWINIKRGCMIAAVIAGWVLVPWKILSSAQTFLAFMGGYAVFLAPISGIMAADYWLVKKTHYDLPGKSFQLLLVLDETTEANIFLNQPSTTPTGATASREGATGARPSPSSSQSRRRCRGWPSASPRASPSRRAPRTCIPSTGCSASSSPSSCTRPSAGSSRPRRRSSPTPSGTTRPSRVSRASSRRLLAAISRRAGARRVLGGAMRRSTTRSLMLSLCSKDGGLCPWLMM